MSPHGCKFSLLFPKTLFRSTAKYPATSQYGFPLPITEFYLSVFRLFLISASVSLQLYFWIEDHGIIEIGRCLWRTTTLVFCSENSYFWCRSRLLGTWSGQSPRFPEPVFGQRRLFLLPQLPFALLHLVTITACPLAGQPREECGFILSLSLGPHPGFRKKSLWLFPLSSSPFWLNQAQFP